MTRIRVNDIQLSVTEQGDGPPLLLVHGFPLDHTMWQAQLDGLSAACRVIAPDLRGFGSSDVSDGVVGMERLADDLASLLDCLQIDQPVAFCGLSMGGYVAWEFWRRHRQRLGTLILCDTKAAADAAEAAQARWQNAARVLGEGTAFLADAMIEKLFAPDTRRHRPELIESVRQTMLAAPPTGVAAALRGMAQRPDSTALLPQIDVPTLVLCGEHDSIAPPDEMRGMAARIPAARFAEIPAAGHMAPLERPAEVNRAIRQFLAA